MSIDASKIYSDLPLPAGVTSESLRPLLGISPDALLVVDQDGILLLLNERTEQLFGYAHHELIGQPLDMLLPEHFRLVHKAHLTRYFSAPTARPMGLGLPLAGRRKDGSQFPVDISLTPLLLDEARCAIVAVRDMTATQYSMAEQLIAYHEIEQHMSMLNLILSATTETVYLLDTQCRYRFASESAAKLLGLTQADFLGKTPCELGLSKVMIEPFMARLQTVLSTGQPVVDELLVPLPGRIRRSEYAALPIIGTDGAVEAVVVSSRDVTEMRQATDTQRRLATIVESSAEAILSKTLEGVVTSWNSSAERLYGYRAEEIIGQSILRLFPPGLYQEGWNILAHVKTGETVKDLETLRLRKDGTPIHVSVTVSPIRDSTGRIIGAATIAHDISEHKRLIQELRDVNTALEDANQALNEANQVREQFISTMSHELRTPLASLLASVRSCCRSFPKKA